METQEKQALSQKDWDLLLPGREYKIGETVITLRPMGLEQFGKVLKALNDLIGEWEKDLRVHAAKQKKKEKEQQVTIVDQLKNFLPKLVNLVEDKGARIISEMANLSLEDVRRLPPAVAVDLFNQCLDINIENAGGLEKNFAGLTTRIIELVGQGNNLAA